MHIIDARCETPFDTIRFYFINCDFFAATQANPQFIQIEFDMTFLKA